MPCWFLLTKNNLETEELESLRKYILLPNMAMISASCYANSGKAILDSLSGYSVPILIVIGIALAFFTTRWIIIKRGQSDFRHSVEALSSRISEALHDLETFFLPYHRVEEEELASLSAQHQGLLSEITILEGHKYYDEDIFLESGISQFKNYITDLQSKKEENNIIVDAIETLKENSTNLKDSYLKLLDPIHYFTYSEMEDWKSHYEDIRPKLDLVLPKYIDYLSDESSKELPALYSTIEIERNKHNQDFVERELNSNRLYFDHILGKYPLDPQQRDSIVKLEDNCLVIASAGSGKTSTILGKAKYLVEKQGIAPSKILLITYTRKAANELHERMKIDGVKCCTFHALAYEIIAQVTGQAPTICDADLALNVFAKLVLNNKDFLHAVNNYIINLQSLMQLEHDYLDAFSYFEDRKKYGIQALFPDVDEKIIFTRSEEEKRLISILSRLGVPFRYENAYEHNTRTPERKQYRPDFTIYYQDNQGNWKWLYLEHFAIDKNGNVPRWFGEGTRGGWNAANQRYKEGIAWKRDTHARFGTTLIETTSADFRDGTVESKLMDLLRNHGVPIKKRTDEELYTLLVKRNRKLEKSVFTLITSFITLMKANEKTVDGLLEGIGNSLVPIPKFSNNYRNRAILTEIIKPFYDAYEDELEKKYEIDFTDAIIQATELCRKGLWKEYDYILVDEFQDISVDRYKLLQALRSERPKTKLYCVGDDWQSIFRFAGSDMSLVYDFEKYFGYTEHCKIETTYRFHQPLIDRSSEFIMRNEEQKKKTIVPPANDTKTTYLKFVKCVCTEDDAVLKQVQEIVDTIPTNKSILLLGRYNYDAMSVGFNGKIDMKDSRIIVNICGRDIPFLSVHSAKGLEADNVILVNCNQGAYGFPSLIEDDPILDFVLSKSETYPFAEERRLFYVAMTRARSCMYVLYDQKKPSPFIGEFLLQVEKGSYLCPRCLEGKMVAIKESMTSNGQKYRSYVCSNHDGGCDFFETKYGDLTPPGIKITDEMTSQDVEKLRESRRKAKQYLSRD